MRILRGVVGTLMVIGGIVLFAVSVGYAFIPFCGVVAGGALIYWGDRIGS